MNRPPHLDRLRTGSTETPHAQPHADGPHRASPILWVLLVAALLRLLHLASAMRNPMTYNPGPDEGFYLQFAGHIAQHGLPIPTDFAFMDPLYGFMAGALFALAGESLFALYLMQTAIDLVTVWLLYRCGIELNRPRAGLIAALLYALCATAIFFTTTALKATWVAAFVVTWTWLALRAARQPGIASWLSLGLLGGVGIALRSNLLLLAPLTILVLPFVARHCGTPWRGLYRPGLGLAAGYLAPLILLAAHNASLGLGWTPMPYNGGVVLHHLYNVENPRALSTYPSFVDYRHPMEIWHGYRREAERIAGRPLAPAEISGYWRQAALAYIAEHPAQSLGNALRKLKEFLAYPEVPNNRMFTHEVQYSPVLRNLPTPFGWLLALGVPGLMLLLAADRRTVLILIPLAVCVATVMVFFAESRFRFHIVPTLVLGGGVFVDQCLRWLHERRAARLMAGTATALAMGLLSVALAAGTPPHSFDPSREAWGYLRMGRPDTAKTLATASIQAGQSNAGIQELLAFIATEYDNDHPTAIAHLNEALELNPASHTARHNLALSLKATGDIDAAIAAIDAVIAQTALADALLLRGELMEHSGRTDEAIADYVRLTEGSRYLHHLKETRLATERLRTLCRTGQGCAPAIEE